MTNTTADQTITIRIGLTTSDRARDYHPMSDGYSLGAQQEVVTLRVQWNPLEDPRAVAEAVFEATNAPYRPEGLGGLVQQRLTGSRLRSLSVGDTVTVETVVGTTMLACEPVGWKAYGELAQPGLERGADAPSQAGAAV